MRPYLILLRNGPIYSLQDRIEYQLLLLSRRFEGELWVTGSFNHHAAIGSFDVHVRKVRQPTPILSHVADALSVIWRAVLLWPTRRGRCAVVTSDPFRNGMIGAVVAFILRSPLIVEVNGCIGDLESFLDHRNSMSEAEKKRARLTAIGRRVLRRASVIRLLFKSQLDGVFVPPARIAVRVNFEGIDLSRFKSIADEHFILFVGFPFYLKGVDVLIRAYLMIADQHPDWRLVLIGYGLEDEAMKITSDPRVQVRKPIPNWEMADWIGRCGFLVLPSRSEAMGRVLLEAAAASKARIATRVGGTYTVVNDGVDGLLVESKDVGALAAALSRLIEDENLRKSMGANARKRAETEFSAEAYLSRFSELVDTATDSLDS